MKKRIRLRAEKDYHSLIPIGIPEVIAKVLAARGVESEVDIALRMRDMLPPDTLSGTQEAARLLHQAWIEQKKITFSGDFDADGATSVALGWEALNSLGFKHVDYIVPNRFNDGYGLSLSLAKQILQKHQSDVVITVDNGISSLEGIAHLKENGVKVIVTDHHLPGTELPNADVIINPNVSGDTFSSKALAGVGVIFYVMLALRKYFRDQGLFNETFIEPNFATLIDLVALGTVADVVPLDRNNRILIAQGLKRIRSKEGRFGISALAKVAQKDLGKLTEQDISFGLAPRLNAAGRLEDMEVGIRCLLATSEKEAIEFAKKLDALNKQRRSIEEGMRDEALIAVEQMDAQSKQLPNIMCLFNERWHVGLIGILASRIVQSFGRPAIVFALDDDHEGEAVLRGSGRSVEGVHLRDLIHAVAVKYQGFILGFGGHAKAAGIKVYKSKLHLFTKAIQREMHKLGLSSDLVVESDGILSGNQLTLELANEVLMHGPWGQNFELPIFHAVFEVVHARYVGYSQKHIKLVIKLDYKLFDAIYFNAPASTPMEGSILVAFRVEVNFSQSVETLQLHVVYIEQHQG